VPFYGCKIFTSDVEAVLNADPSLRAAFQSFQLRRADDAQHNEVLVIALERSSRLEAPIPPLHEVRRAMYNGLARVNQDFREVSRMFTEEKLVIEVHESGRGPFTNKDIRVKSRYIA